MISALFDKVTDAAQKLSEPFVRWRGHRVMNLDGFCSSMEDNPELHEAFGTSNGRHGAGRYPLARVVDGALQLNGNVKSYDVLGALCALGVERGTPCRASRRMTPDA